MKLIQFIIGITIVCFYTLLIRKVFIFLNHEHMSFFQKAWGFYLLMLITLLAYCCLKYFLRKKVILRHKFSLPLNPNYGLLKGCQQRVKYKSLTNEEKLENDYFFQIVFSEFKKDINVIKFGILFSILGPISIAGILFWPYSYTDKFNRP